MEQRNEREVVQPVVLVRGDEAAAPAATGASMPVWGWAIVAVVAAVGLAAALERARRTVGRSPTERGAERLARMLRLTREEYKLVERMAEGVGEAGGKAGAVCAVLVSQQVFARAAGGVVREKGDGAAVTALHGKIYGTP